MGKWHLELIPRLATRLVGFLVVGTRTWFIMFLRLMMFTICLTPGWIMLLRYYLWDENIIRDVDYGQGAKDRNMLDIYLPLKKYDNKLSGNDKNVRESNSCGGQSPVIVIVSGGAWIIGYKLWSALLARAFASKGLLVLVPDYRNFPQGTCEDMMDDIERALLWTRSNVKRFGGDENNIIIAGQSAGAHISLCLLLRPLREALAALIQKSSSSRINKRPGSRSSNSSRPNTPSTPRTPNHNIRDTTVTHSAVSWKYSVSLLLQNILDCLQWFFLVVSKRIGIYKFAEPSEITVPAINIDSVQIPRLSDVSCIDVKLFVGISGPYDLHFLEGHLHNRGTCVYDISIRTD